MLYEVITYVSVVVGNTQQQAHRKERGLGSGKAHQNLYDGIAYNGFFFGLNHLPEFIANDYLGSSGFVGNHIAMALQSSFGPERANAVAT